MADMGAKSRGEEKGICPREIVGLKALRVSNFFWSGAEKRKPKEGDGFSSIGLLIPFDKGYGKDIGFPPAMRYAIFFILLIGSLKSLAFDDSYFPLREREVKKVLKAQGLDQSSVEYIVGILKRSPGAENEESDLKLSTILFAHGLNGALFIDNDNWNVDAALKI